MDNKIIAKKLARKTIKAKKIPHIKQYVEEPDLEYVKEYSVLYVPSKYQVFCNDILIGEIDEQYQSIKYIEDANMFHNILNYMLEEMEKIQAQSRNQRSKKYIKIITNLFSKYGQNPSIREVAEKGVVLVINEEGVSLDLIKIHKSSLNYERYRIVTLYGFNLDEEISRPIDSSRIVKSELTTQEQVDLYNAFVGYILD